MNLSVSDISGGLLIVSQFTLFADTKKGNRPSFIRSARQEQARPLYDYFLSQLKKSFIGNYVSIKWTWITKSISLDDKYIK